MGFSTLTQRKSQEFSSVQALRAVAAMVVVLFHLLPFEARYMPGSPVIPQIFVLGEYGVDLFFVISGFIITMSSRGLFQDRRGALSFLVRRLTRVYPLYWFYAAILLAVYAIQPHIFSGARGRPDILASFLLYPSNGALLLLVSWTLTFEVQFYLIFTTALLLVSEKKLPLVIAAWAVIIVARGILFDGTLGRAEILFDKLNMEFIFGCLIAFYASHLSKRVGILSFIAAMALCLTGGLLFRRMDGSLEDGWPRILFAGGGASFVLLAAVIWEADLRRWLPRALVVQGSWSYSMYLSHLLVIAIVGLLWKVISVQTGPVTHVLALTTAFLTSIVFAWTSFRYVERPLLKVSRRSMSREGETPSSMRPI